MKPSVVISFCLIFIIYCVVPNCSGMFVEDKTNDQVISLSSNAAPSSTESTNPEEHLGFIQAFIGSFSVIIVSELGDKTFFIAAIMAMTHPRILVFFGAFLALAFMTVLSVAFGWIVTFFPKMYIYYVSTVLFIIFGVKMIRDGLKMTPNDAQEEYQEVQADLKKKNEEFEKETLTKDVESGHVNRNAKVKILKVLSHTSIIVQAFTLTFLAEWGDRSQFTTIILAARHDVYGVALGGFIGHSVCTGLAVIGGRFIAQKISVKTITIIGGFVFIIFAVVTILLQS